MEISIKTIDNRIFDTLNIQQDDVNMNYLLAKYVRVHSINSAQNTKSTKGVSDVKGHSKKPYKQKGTGYARQGSTKAPHHRGGGVAHGPKPIQRSARLNKKEREILRKNLLYTLLSNDRVYINDKDNLDKDFVSKFRRIVYVVNQEPPVSCRKFSNIIFSDTDSLSPLLISASDVIIVDKSSLDEFKKMLS